MDFTFDQEIQARCSNEGRVYHTARVMAWDPEAPDMLLVVWQSRRPDAQDQEAVIPRSWVFEPDRRRVRRPPQRYHPEPVRQRSPPRGALVRKFRDPREARNPK